MQKVDKDRKKNMKGLEAKMVQLSKQQKDADGDESEDELPEGVLGDSLGKVMDDVMEVCFLMKHQGGGFDTTQRI